MSCMDCSCESQELIHDYSGDRGLPRAESRSVDDSTCELYASGQEQASRWCDGKRFDLKKLLMSQANDGRKTGVIDPVRGELQVVGRYLRKNNITGGWRYGVPRLVGFDGRYRRYSGTGDAPRCFCKRRESRLNCSRSPTDETTLIPRIWDYRDGNFEGGEFRLINLLTRARGKDWNG